MASSSSSSTRFWCLAVVVVAVLAGSCRTAAGAAVPLAAVKAVSQCAASPDAMDCLMRAAAAGVDALARSVEPVDLVPGCVTLVKNVVADPEPTVATSTVPSVTVNVAANTIAAAAASAAAAAATARSDNGSAAPVSAETVLVDSVTAFAKSRAISVRAPAYMLDSLKNTLIEARGKKDKYAGPLLMGAMMVAGTLLPIKLGALAMMSGKALMTSMLALMLSAILALKKLASGGGSHSGTTYEVINVPTHGAHGPHGRSLAQSLAYGLPLEPTVPTAQR